MRPARFCSSTLQQCLRQESNLTNELRRLVPGIRQDEGDGLPARSRTWHKCFRRTPPGIRQDEERTRMKARRETRRSALSAQRAALVRSTRHRRRRVARERGEASPRSVEGTRRVPQGRGKERSRTPYPLEYVLLSRQSWLPASFPSRTVRTAGVEPAISSPPDWRFCQLSYALIQQSSIEPSSARAQHEAPPEARSRGEAPREAWRGGRRHPQE